MMLSRIAFFFIFAVLMTGSSAFAKVPRPGLTKGMSIEEVLRLWGAPQDKTEQEIKRIEIWRYPEGDLFFHEGVLDIYPGSDGQQVEKSNSEPITLLETKKQTKKTYSSVAMDEVFNDVLKSMPADSDKGSRPSSGPGMIPGQFPGGPGVPPGMMRSIPGRPGDIDDDTNID